MVSHRRILWLVAIVFIVACFVSGAWLGKTLSAMPPVAPSSSSSIDRTDQETLRVKERETAIVTAVASPAAVLIVFLLALVVSGILTRSEEAETPQDRR